MSTKRSSNRRSIPKDPSSFYQNYENQILIKKGGFGTVFRATERFSKREVAIKCVKLRIGTEEKVLKELQILSALEHPHILRYYHSWTEPFEYHKERDGILFPRSDLIPSFKFSTTDTSSRLGRTCDDGDVNMGRPLAISSVDMGMILEPSEQNQMPIQRVSSASNKNAAASQNDQSEGEKSFGPYEYLFIVTSLCKSESLQDRLAPDHRLKNPISRFEALYIFYQIVTGVRYLHIRKNMIHCDLKPGNIVFSLSNDTVKIADFGLTRTEKASLSVENDVASSHPKQTAGTPLYMRPSEPASFERDIYALGVILFELLYPVSSACEQEQLLKNLQKTNVELPNDFEKKCASPMLKSLVCQLLSANPKERPNIYQLHQSIQRRLESDDFEEDDVMVSKLEHVLNNSPSKEIALTTDEIQYGVYDTSDQYILLSDDRRLKLYNLDGELIDEYAGLHEYSHIVGYIQRIVWCEYLGQFLILFRKFLYGFVPHSNNGLSQMKKMHFIDRYRGDDELRFITCINKVFFINYSYAILRRYDAPQRILTHQWTKEKLFYQQTDQIRAMTCSRTNDYLALNVCLDQCQYIIDLRRIDDNLTWLKRIQMPNLTLKHKLQLSSREWLISTGKSHFSVLDVSEEEVNLKTIQTNVTSESDIYPRFFNSHLIVPIIRKQQNTQSNEDGSIQMKGFLEFYKWN